MKKGNYVIGYGKPPKNTQFQPGQSGNPKGRPKGVKNLANDLDEELSEKITITEAGKQQETTKQRAMIKTMFAKALKGDTRAANVLINLILGLEQSKQAKQDADQLSDEDMEILNTFKEKILADNLQPEARKEKEDD